MSVITNNFTLSPISSNLPDVDKPLSFKDWKKSFQIIQPTRAYDQYNEYLVAWYKNKSISRQGLNVDIRLNYLQLLKQIQIFFTEQEKENWYAGVDLENEKEILLAIPYFARKLRDVSLYYLNLREEVKKSKIKYNIRGTNLGTIKQIQDIFLKNYTKSADTPIELPSTLWSNVPQLSSLKENLIIEIEELYDSNSYFDRTNTLPPSAYFNLSLETENYFKRKGLSLLDIDWVYRLGTSTLSSLFTPTTSTATPETTSLYFDLASKYLGSDRFSTLFVRSSAKTDFYNVQINSGNNSFYWPYGPYKSNVELLPRYKPVPLSSTSLQTLATPGSSIELADTIFVKTKNGIEGAWFRKKVIDTTPATIEASIDGNNITIFRYPFPGYGVSAEDIQWTGYGLKTDPRFFYLDSSIRKVIEGVYWGTSFELSGTLPLTVNTTTLIDNGAYASQDFNIADKIRVWKIPPQYSDSSYTNTVNEAWLYKFLNTQISVGTDSNNTIVWPFNKIENFNNALPDYPFNICLPVELSATNLPFAIASNNLSSADVIYKISNYRDGVSDATEGVWLSGEEFTYPETGTSGISQSHFSGLFEPGTFTSFIWDSPLTDVNTVFRGNYKHLPDCKFATTLNTTYKDYNLCTCKQVNFSPFGHPGINYFDFNALADFIVEDTGNVLEPFNITTWRDSLSSSFLQSSNAAWFKTSKNIGWGDGTWYSGSTINGNTLFLKPGHRYFYFRVIPSTLSEQDNISYPELVVRYEKPKNLNKKRKWIQAINQDGDWISTGKEVNLQLFPGDTLIYSRYGTTSYSITGETLTEQQVYENRGSIWSNYDYISINNNLFPVIVTYPSYLIGTSSSIPRSSESQYPVLPLESIDSVLAWKITDPTGNSEYKYNVNTFSFIPTITSGTPYTISVTALTSQVVSNTLVSGYYVFTNIPGITALPSSVFVPSLSVIETPVPGFVWSTKLQGWNYSINARTSLISESVTGNNIGAVPFWAKSNLEKNESTDYKSIESWGLSQRIVDSYNVITQPEISDIILTGGEYIEYNRKYGSDLLWKQPVTLTTRTENNIWSKLEVAAQNITTPFNLSTNLISNPTTENSTILLENYVENEPVEVFYNAITPFTWSITAEPQIEEPIISTPLSSTVITSYEPWQNLKNQFNPTRAFLPAFDALENSKVTGEYFKPTNLGLLTYVNKDYTFNITVTATQDLELYEAPSKKINNRGLTKTQQISPYAISFDNNIWLKEPFTTGSLAGTIKKEIFKRYQKFIPYQSTYETNNLSRLGLTTPVSRQTPWGGSDDTTWNDPENYPRSFTGEINVKNWSDDQVLKNTTLKLDNWVFDIYNNQYGLYKDINNVLPSKRITIPGAVWVRKSSQKTEVGSTALKEIYDTYKTISLYNELTGSGIYKIDCFYNTLYFETSTALLFERVQYDYTTDTIFSIADNARGISLRTPIDINLNREFSNTISLNTSLAIPGDTWFFPNENTVYVSVNELSGFRIKPNFITYNILKIQLEKLPTDFPELSSLDSLSAVKLSRPLLSYDSSNRQFLYTFTATDALNQQSIVELTFNKVPVLSLKYINVYTSQQKELLPPIILSDLYFTIPTSSTFSYQLTATTTDVVFEPINFPSWASISSSGMFTCTAPNYSDVFTLQFKASNSVGPIYSSLIINTV